MHFSTSLNFVVHSSMAADFWEITLQNGIKGLHSMQPGIWQQQCSQSKRKNS